MQETLKEFQHNVDFIVNQKARFINKLVEHFVKFYNTDIRSKHQQTFYKVKLMENYSFELSIHLLQSSFLREF